MAGISKRYRWIGAGLVAALAASTMSGCGGGAKSASSTFEFWSQWRKGEPQQQVLEQAINEFTAQTKIKVKVQWAGRDVGKKIQAGANAGQVLDGASGDAPQWWSNVFLPLDNKLFFGELSADQFVSELTKQSKQFWQNN